jgi:hypothetical protein
VCNSCQSGHYLRNSSTLDIGVLGYIGIFYRKEHSPELLYSPPGTPCIYAWLQVGRNYSFVTGTKQAFLSMQFPTP